jgi:pyridoxine 5-phosphate synthase
MSHIRYQDARDLKAVVYTEFNIEGNRNITYRFGFRMQTRAGNFSSRRYWRINLFCRMGYGKNQAYLTEMIQEFQRNGIRTSIL